VFNWTPKSASQTPHIASALVMSTSSAKNPKQALDEDLEARNTFVMLIANKTYCHL